MDTRFFEIKATTKQLGYLCALAEEAGFSSLRDAAATVFGLSSSKATAKASRLSASKMIDGLKERIEANARREAAKAAREAKAPVEVVAPSVNVEVVAPVPVFWRMRPGSVVEPCEPKEATFLATPNGVRWMVVVSGGESVDCHTEEEARQIADAHHGVIFAVVVVR